MPEEEQDKKTYDFFNNNIFHKIEEGQNGTFIGYGGFRSGKSF